MTAPVPLFMIQMQPDMPRAAAWMERHGVTRRGHDDGYGWHALLAAAFGELAPQPFRLVEAKRRGAQLLAYALSTPAALREHATSFAEPAAVAALNLAEFDHKQMPDFPAGRRLGFEVRVRPTVRQDRDGDRRRSREKDAFLAALDKALREGREAVDRADAYRDWLAARLGGAARLERFEIAATRRTMLLRRRAIGENGGGRELVSVGSNRSRVAGEQGGGPDAVFAGVLTVADPAAFHGLLARGIGRHRAFGFGMLLLRPPGG